MLISPLAALIETLMTGQPLRKSFANRSPFDAATCASATADEFMHARFPFSNMSKSSILNSPKLMEREVPSSISKLKDGDDKISFPAESKQLTKTAPKNERQGPSLMAAIKIGT